ncbi:unnamed protein product [Sphagnum compactum]
MASNSRRLADLSAHLDSTLLKITDGSNEEEGDLAEFTWKERENEKVRLGPESPDMLARGRVYEKALGEARHNTRIEKFLVMELEKDGKLIDYLSLNLPEVRRLKIACWAATCNFVHMVMALIHCRDEGDREFLYRVLTIAVEFGYVELVKRLTEREEFDVNRGRRIVDFDDIYLREVGKPIQRTVYETDCLYYYAISDRLSPLNLAAKLGKVEIVNAFLACERIHRALSPESYWALRWAAKMEHAEVIDAILLNKDVNAAVSMTVEKSLIVYRLSYGFDTSFPWLNGSDIGPFCKVSFTPLQLASLYGHRSVLKVLKERLEATIEYDTRVATLRVASEMRRDEIVKILIDIPEIENFVKILDKERQTHVNAANTILVVAALIGSVTFASGLQPPLGYSPINLHMGAPSPDGMYPSFASVEGHPNMPFFYICNSLSFVFAIVALVMASAAALPAPTDRSIGLMMPYLRRALVSAYIFLCFSLLCFVSTFVTAGGIVFPPVQTFPLMNSLVYALVFVLAAVTGVLLQPSHLSAPSLRDAFVTAYFIVAGICYDFFHHMKNYRYFYCLVFVIYTGWMVFCIL